MVSKVRIIWKQTVRETASSAGKSGAGTGQMTKNEGTPAGTASAVDGTAVAAGSVQMIEFGHAPIHAVDTAGSDDSARCGFGARVRAGVFSLARLARHCTRASRRVVLLRCGGVSWRACTGACGYNRPFEIMHD